VRGTVAEVRHELAARDRMRGEITLLVEAPAQTRPSAGAPILATADEKMADRVARMKAETGVDEKEALKRLARELGRSKSEVYRELQRERAGKR
jgi:16S rRNA (cytidine1402-2'-O)-methyltransferase